MKKVLVTALSLGVFAWAGSAMAALIDFTSEYWKDVQGKQSYSKIDGGINVTLEAFGISEFFKIDVSNTLTWNEGFDGGSDNDLGLAANGDGIGIKTGWGIGGLVDEVAYTQTLKISFAPDVRVNSIFAYDIDHNDYVKYRLGGGGWVNQYGSQPSFSFATGSNQYVSWVEFTGGSLKNSFSVAAVDVSPVPEPATMLIFGAGLAGLAAVGRRRKTE